MKLIKRQFFVTNKSIIEAVGEGAVKFLIPNNDIVRIEKIIYAPDYDFNLILLD